MYQIIETLRAYMYAGGDVLWAIAFATFVMWAMIFERFWFINTAHKRDVSNALAYWENRAERTSWYAHMIRNRLVSEVNSRIEVNMDFIKTMIALLPLLGLLGTVTGMVQVFEAMNFSGGNARTMAAGVSAATIPTMSGMVATLSGVFANTYLSTKVSHECQYMEDTLTTDH